MKDEDVAYKVYLYVLCHTNRYVLRHTDLLIKIQILLFRT